MSDCLLGMTIVVCCLIGVICCLLYALWNLTDWKDTGDE
jgi:hypothetical protein